MGDAIRIAGLVKRFGAFTALDGMDLDVAEGEVHGLLGPNGAGKSTAIRVLLGLLRADGGTVELLGADPWHDAVRLHRRLAYVPGDVSLWPGMTGGEAIDLLGTLRGGLDERRRAHLIERFELDPTKKGRGYSKGNRQKVAIVAALASDVELLILDEPTAGLDPLMGAIFQEEIAAEKARGRSILLSSHTLSEVEALADRISIIRDGRTVDSGTLEQMRRQARTSVSATLLTPMTDPGAVPGVTNAVLDGPRFSCTLDPEHLTTLMAHLSQHGIAALTVTPPSLEDLFLKHYDAATDQGTAPDRDAPVTT